VKVGVGGGGGGTRWRGMVIGVKVGGGKGEVGEGSRGGGTRGDREGGEDTEEGRKGVVVEGGEVIKYRDE